MVGVWEGLNLGSIPNDHMPSQKDPKISIERRCSTILPNLEKGIHSICHCLMSINEAQNCERVAPGNNCNFCQDC